MLLGSQLFPFGPKRHVLQATFGHCDFPPREPFHRKGQETVNVGLPLNL